MRGIAAATVGLVLVGVVPAQAYVGSASPSLRAKQAEAHAVLRRVNALDVRFGKVVDRWDGARIQLAASERQLAANERLLRRARRKVRIAEARRARVLVAIYENGQPTIADIVVGASSVSDLIDRIDAAQTVNAYDRRVAMQAQHWRATLAATRARLQKAERTRRRTVSQLTRERGEIGAMLTRRRRLLASVQAEVAVLRAREAARQHALAVAARARLARAQAARAAAARAAAERVAAAPVTVAQTTTAAVLPPPPPTTAETTAPVASVPTPPTAATTTAASAVPAAGPGHPEAATIALRYLGIPYQWGGASPATGFDCSGLVMYVYAQLGINLPHQSAAQYHYGVPVSRADLEPGDLVFYDDLSHVAIYIGNGQIVHAPQTGDVVKIAPLSQGGGSYDGARRL
jgi:peptidoglycan DL-endopeptidase CwlO